MYNGKHFPEQKEKFYLLHHLNVKGKLQGKRSSDLKGLIYQINYERR